MEGAVIGGVSAAAFYGVGAANCSGFQAAEGAARVVAFGSVGGISSELSGGKFGHGGISAGVGELVGSSVTLRGTGGSAGEIVGRTVAKTIIGGTVSEVRGVSSQMGQLRRRLRVSSAKWRHSVQPGAEI